MGGSAHEIQFLCRVYLTIRNGGIQAGEWLFPAVLLADLDFEPINLAEQFVPTYLFGDISPINAGGLPPGTADLGLGFRLGFLQLQYPISYLRLTDFFIFCINLRLKDTGVPRP